MGFLRAHRKLFILNFVSAITFCILLFFVTNSELRPIDLKTDNTIAIFRHEAITNVMLAVSEVFQPAIIVSISALLFVFLMFNKKKNLAKLFLYSSTLSVLFGLIIKKILSIPRPTDSLVSEIGSSFPSIHATAASVFFIVLAYSVERKINDAVLETLFVAMSLSMIILTGISRVYLGVHWLSDVLAGFAFGAFFATLGIIVMRFLEEKGKAL